MSSAEQPGRQARYVGIRRPAALPSSRFLLAAFTASLAALLALGTLFLPASARADLITNVPEASGYQLVYSLNLPSAATYNTTGVTYGINNAATVTQPFDRIAYYLELQKPAEAAQWVYVSMNAFTADLSKIGVPALGTSASFQQNVRKMNVYSNVGSIVTGTNLTGGNIEFWPNNYSAANGGAVPNASGTTYDAGDTVTTATPNGYGSMQVHNHLATSTTAQTIFAFNRWGAGGGNADLGIGNNTRTATNGQTNPDWTFLNNAAEYSLKNLQVLIRPGTPVPPPTPIKIMPLGDSITNGSGALGGYRTRLYNNFVAADVNVQLVGSATSNASTPLTNAGQANHEGHGGYRIDQIANNLDGADSSTGNNGGYWFPGTGARGAVDPDFILLLIGTNDFGQNYNISTAIDRFDALITQITTDRPNAKLLVSNLLKRTDNLTAEANIEALFNPYVPGIIDAHRANGEQVYFVDLNSIVDPATDLVDKLHPNQQGYDKMGDAWYSAIMTLVPEPTGMLPLALGIIVLMRRVRHVSPR